MGARPTFQYLVALQNPNDIAGSFYSAHAAGVRRINSLCVGPSGVGLIIVLLLPVCKIPSCSHPSYYSASIERKGQAQPLAAALATATTVLCGLMLTLLTGAVAVACTVWFSDPNVPLSKHSGQLSRELAATAGVVTAHETQTLRDLRAPA